MKEGFRFKCIGCGDVLTNNTKGKTATMRNPICKSCEQKQSKKFFSGTDEKIIYAMKKNAKNIIAFLIGVIIVIALGRQS